MSTGFIATAAGIYLGAFLVPLTCFYIAKTHYHSTK